MRAPPYSFYSMPWNTPVNQLPHTRPLFIAAAIWLCVCVNYIIGPSVNNNIIMETKLRNWNVLTFCLQCITCYGARYYLIHRKSKIQRWILRPRRLHCARDRTKKFPPQLLVSNRSYINPWNNAVRLPAYKPFKHLRWTTSVVNIPALLHGLTSSIKRYRTISLSPVELPNQSTTPYLQWLLCSSFIIKGALLCLHNSLNSGCWQELTLLAPNLSTSHNSSSRAKSRECDPLVERGSLRHVFCWSATQTESRLITKPQHRINREKRSFWPAHFTCRVLPYSCAVFTQISFDFSSGKAE
jgi:hypothetical protein